MVKNMTLNLNSEEGEKAVSAVIGVILMVVITVAIAATIYAYISGNIGVQQQTVPTVQMMAIENVERLSVLNTDTELNWTNLAIRSTAAVSIYINGEADAGNCLNLTANEYHKFAMSDISSISGIIHGSDFIDIEGTSGNLVDVTITVIHDDTDTTLEIYSFSRISQLS